MINTNDLKKQRDELNLVEKELKRIEELILQSNNIGRTLATVDTDPNSVYYQEILDAIKKHGYSVEVDSYWNSKLYIRWE